MTSPSALTGVVLVALGGALGASGRYWLSGWIAAQMMAAGASSSVSSPVGTLAVNAIGGALIGLLAALLPVGPARLFLMTGVLGGFTTFSAFSLEVVTLTEAGRFGLALLYALASVVASVLSAALGLFIGRQLAT